MTGNLSESCLKTKVSFNISAIKSVVQVLLLARKSFFRSIYLSCWPEIDAARGNRSNINVNGERKKAHP